MTAQLKLEPDTVQGFKLVASKLSCVSKVIFDKSEASARLLLGLKVIVSEPLPAELDPVSAVTDDM